MEKHDILLNLRGYYGSDSFFGAETQLLTEGTLTLKDGAYIIEYNEGSGSDARANKIRLVADGGNIRLQCGESLETDLLFADRQCFLTAYETPQGLIEVTILPSRVESSLTPEGGTINLVYTIRFGNTSMCNKLHIDYRQKN